MYYKTIYQLGQRLRNPSLHRWYSFLKKTEQWSLDELRHYQFNKLKELIYLAYAHSEFYNEECKHIGVSPKDLKSIADLDKFPIISKENLLKNVQKNHTNLKFKRKLRARTSGSTGKSLVFFREETADSFNRAAIFRGYSWFGVKPWDRNGYIWGYNFSFKEKLKTIFLDALQNRFRLFSLEKRKIKGFVKKLEKAHYLQGYSSLIFEVSKHINLNNYKKPENLKMVKGTSEKIYDSYQQEIEKAFGLKMISEYGAAESGVIAFECPQGNMHITMEGVIVEEKNNEILVTNLQMQSFPIIRYKLGDYIKLASEEKKCNCGMQHGIIEEVAGRVGNLVYGLKNTYPSLYFYYIFKNLAKTYQLFLTYQVHQHYKGALIFFIEQTLNKQDLLRLQNEIKKYFKDDITVQVKQGQVIKSEGAKLKSFISNLS